MDFSAKLQFPENAEPMPEDVLEIFTIAATVEAAFKRHKREIPSIEEGEGPSVRSLVEKRIKAFDLPIGFTPTGIIAIECLSGGNPGRVVVILIDCLNKFRPRRDVGLEDISKIYPHGFYKKEALKDYVDNYIKPRKIEWSSIY
jgi:hypothetical protein